MRNQSFSVSCLIVSVLQIISVRSSAAQAPTASLAVHVVDAGGGVAGATVMAGGQSGVTDSTGAAVLGLPPGSYRVVATKDGYGIAVGSAEIAAGPGTRIIRLELTMKPGGQDDPVVVGSTRIATRLEQQALPIEVAGARTVADTTLISPANVVTVLDNMQTVRARMTSPELGLTMFRIRGLPGHYTRLFSDGVPLDFDRSGGLPPVQLSPMDVAQVEVLTDGASSIFGMNALSGAINMLSRRPAAAPAREILFSQSASGGTDGGLWFSTPPTRNWSTANFFAGSFQDERDVDGDGWSDFPGARRGQARTRVFYDNRRGKSASGTAGVMFEKREGGSDFAHQELESKEADGALFGQMPWGKYTLSGAATLFVQSRRRVFPDRVEHERRQSATIEFNLSRRLDRNTWLVGIASEWFANRTPTVPLPSAYVYTGPSMYAHDEFRLSPWLTASGSARLDFHLDDGAVLSPRGSILIHKGPWASHVSAGRSYSKPKQLTEETEAAGYAHLTIDGAIDRESADSVSADVTHTTSSSVVSAAVFRTQVNHPAMVDRTTFTLRTEPDPLVANGAELLGTVRHAGFAVTGTYVYLRARERGDVEVALTPRHSGGVTASMTTKGGARFGLQALYTGVQRLDRNPYRTQSEAYTLVNLLAEYPFGRWHVFANAENLTDVRQTNWDPIARMAPDIDGRWTVDVWAPLRGRVINVGVKVA
ncbi:MAG TPA: TonB-dependent receptor, partial [Vicinamibacterales bacterium]|nr:TonB-dependent receptor [Vicinamibacterales bacterium]